MSSTTKNEIANGNKDMARDSYQCTHLSLLVIVLLHIFLHHLSVLSINLDSILTFQSHHIHINVPVASDVSNHEQVVTIRALLPLLPLLFCFLIYLLLPISLFYFVFIFLLSLFSLFAGKMRSVCFWSH